MSSWQGRSAWVIGASSGIGAAVAQELLKRGCDVTISARTESSLHDVAQGRMHVVPVDISDTASVTRAARTIGRFDVVIVVAGFWKQMSGRGFDFDVFAQHNDVNVLGLARCVSAVVPRMLEQGAGTFVGVSSVAGYRGMPGSSGYGPSKAAQLNLLESLRCDLRGTGVDVVTVSPGFVRTPMTDVNEFPMPFIIDADEAARFIVDGLERRKPEIVFPRPMMLLMKAARLVPQRWWPRLFKPASP